MAVSGGRRFKVRRLSALREIARERASCVVFPLPYHVPTDNCEPTYRVNAGFFPPRTRSTAQNQFSADDDDRPPSRVPR